jgi:DNA/RNA-binding domain of Phe-tRNA-synthetase-like protein
MNHGVHVSPAILEAWPGYTAVVVIAEGVANGPSDAVSERILADAERTAGESGLARAADDPRIAGWRAAFSRFGAKPSRYPSSAESLLARVLNGERLPRINALVDTYNAVSLRHLIPVGGEDLDALRGDLRLVRATGDEAFEARDGADDPPRPGEVVWRDDLGVTCRRWNWRQGRRTQLTEATTRAFFVFDGLPPLDAAAVEAAVDELVGHLRDRSPDVRLRVERPSISAASAERRPA